MSEHACTIRNEGVKETGAWRVDCSCGWYAAGIKNSKQASKIAAKHLAGANEGEPVRG